MRPRPPPRSTQEVLRELRPELTARRRLASFAWPLGECRMRVELAIDGTEVSLGRNDALQHGASEGDVKYVSRRQVVLKAEGGLVASRSSTRRGAARTAPRARRCSSTSKWA